MLALMLPADTIRGDVAAQALSPKQPWNLSEPSVGHREPAIKRLCLDLLARALAARRSEAQSASLMTILAPAFTLSNSILFIRSRTKESFALIAMTLNLTWRCPVLKCPGRLNA